MSRVSIRKFQDQWPWFVPNADLTNAITQYKVVVLKDVIFNPKAPVMKDVFCGSGHISEADATGELVEEVPYQGIAKKFKIGYDTKNKHFFSKDEPEVPITEVDYLSMDGDGATAYMMA